MQKTKEGRFSDPETLGSLMFDRCPECSGVGRVSGEQCGYCSGRGVKLTDLGRRLARESADRVLELMSS